METITLHTRIPKKVKDDIEELVEEGYYSSTADFLRDSARKAIREWRGKFEKDTPPEGTLKQLKDMRKKLWGEAIKEAKGDSYKAAKLYMKKLEL